MGHRPDKLVRGPFRQPRVGVERDYEPYPIGYGRLSFTDGNERCVAGATKQSIQLMELPAFAFPGDPLPFLAFLLIPQSTAMKQEEPVTSAGGAAVTFV